MLYQPISAPAAEQKKTPNYSKSNLNCELSHCLLPGPSRSFTGSPHLTEKHKLSLQGSGAQTISAGRGRDHDNADGNDGDIFCGGFGTQVGTCRMLEGR